MEPKPQDSNDIFQAAEKGNQITVQAVLERLEKTGKKIQDVINEADSKKKTALHYATQGQHVTLATFLIENGADVQAKNLAGQTGIF